MILNSAGEMINSEYLDQITVWYVSPFFSGISVRIFKVDNKNRGNFVKKCERLGIGILFENSTRMFHNKIKYSDTATFHYENTSIQILRKFHLQKLKIFS